MSEDSATGFNAAAMPGKALQICADSAALGALIGAAGWPVSPDARAPVCNVYALDWHDAVGDDPSTIAPSSDCALLCIASLETLDQADALLQARDVHYVIGRDTAQIGAALAEIAA
ncbi:hypothetical protein, partial [Blastomonas sp.]|uniref:hypothetical protein n=1 Tax=Blastomonas sp. TaxID=1909299 RepID=UPI003593D138